MQKYLAKDLERLLIALKPLNGIVHEPDNNGISAIVEGTHLDNAMGDNPVTNCGEFTIGIVNDNDEDIRIEYFNIADLLQIIIEQSKTIDTIKNLV
jgi:hypothetical protein